MAWQEIPRGAIHFYLQFGVTLTSFGVRTRFSLITRHHTLEFVFDYPVPLARARIEVISHYDCKKIRDCPEAAASHQAIVIAELYRDVRSRKIFNVSIPPPNEWAVVLPTLKKLSALDPGLHEFYRVRLLAIPAIADLRSIVKS